MSSDLSDVSGTPLSDNELPEVQFLPHDLPLKSDIRTLGKILGETLIQSEGLAFFNRVERVRLAAIERRTGVDSADADRRLTDMLSDLEPQTGATLARAFSAYFGLVNMAERIHSIRQHMHALDAGEPAPESFAAVLATLKASGLGFDALSAILNDLCFTPVFTAHPTEAVRRTLLAKEVRIAQDLVKRIDPASAGAYRNDVALAQVRHEVGVSWQTDELSDQPSVDDEVEHVLFFLSEVVYRIIPAFYRRLAQAAVSVYGRDPIAGQDHRLVRFASWVGGDMDGNPNVGADTINATLARQQKIIIDRYCGELRELFEQLSHAQRLVSVSAECQARTDEYRARMPDIFAAIPERYRQMPYRVLLNFVEARLRGLIAADADAYESASEFHADLALIADSIEQHGDTGSYLVKRLLRRAQTFGFHMVTLDVRQDSLVHRRAIAQALDDPTLVDAVRERRVEALTAALSLVPRESSVDPQSDSELDQCLAVLRAIAASQRRYGNDAIGPYIISMAEGADDALAVLYLARLAGLVDAQGQVSLDIAPLFETVDDLENAAATMTALLRHPLYRQHLRTRGDKQVVMLGYSDSSKESGMAASRWALFQAQRQLMESADVAPGEPVELTFFHGRGGTISRGGGGTHPRNGILAEPVGAMQGHLRVTEQGEIIAQKYGLRDVALRTIEMATGALLERCALGQRGKLAPDWESAAELLASRARQAYHKIVHDDPDLIPYFRLATPIDVIERLRIGSRPPSRRKGDSVADLRAIPWVFAWTQSRHLFTGWYGVGTGLEAAIEQFGIDMVRSMANEWLYFGNLIADTEMVVAKTDMSIARHYADLAGDLADRIYPQLLAEFERTQHWICALREQDKPLDRDPQLQRNIRLRDPYVDPLSLLQVDFLRRWRAAGRDDPELERALIITVKGIARGMQNTG